MFFKKLWDRATAFFFPTDVEHEALWNVAMACACMVSAVAKELDADSNGNNAFMTGLTSEYPEDQLDTSITIVYTAIHLTFVAKYISGYEDALHTNTTYGDQLYDACNQLISDSNDCADHIISPSTYHVWRSHILRIHGPLCDALREA